MFKRNNLNNILSTFMETKVQLKAFISENTKKMEKLELDLKKASDDHATATNALQQITKIVGGK